MENKQLICEKLLALLQETRAGCDLVDIQYEKDIKAETATLIFSNGYKVLVDVSADSGISMIRDITRHL